MWVCKVGCVLTRECRAGNQSCLVLYQDNQVLYVIGSLFLVNMILKTQFKEEKLYCATLNISLSSQALLHCQWIQQHTPHMLSAALSNTKMSHLIQ